MTREEVTRLLLETLIDEKFDVWSNAKDVAIKLNRLYPQLDFGYDYLAKEQRCYVTYKKRYLVGFKLTKKRGDYHRFMGYDWIIANVEVFNWFDNLEDRIASIDKDVVLQQEKEKNEQAIKIANFKKIRELFPDVNAWKFNEILKGVSDVAYDEIEKEKLV